MTSETQATNAATEVRCSFCAKPSAEVEKVIAGPGVYICNECVGLCRDILEIERQEPSGPGTGLSSWDETMTDDQILDLLPRIAAVGAQTEITRQSAWERFSGEE